MTIYANSGPLAAKRHRVYSHAVQTLVSVRNRQSKQQVLSEADLRHRLGYLAFSLFWHHAADIPTKEKVVAFIAESIRNESTETDPQKVARDFVQQVAEATGLLVIHSRPSAPSSDTVTFLHHSFLEYYAAIGFLETRDLTMLRKLAVYPRWREVIAVMAGIVGDSADVTSFITDLMRDIDADDSITKDDLLFAFDCALECDVPPEETQKRIMEGVRSAIEVGPALFDPDLRRDIGERLGKLWVACRSVHVKALIENGL